MLGGEDAGEAGRAPTVEHAVEHARLVGRVDERDVVRLGRESGDEGQRVALEDAGPVAQAKRGDVGAQGMQAGGAELDEVGAVGATRDRLKAERAGAGEEVEHARGGQVGAEGVEQCGANVFRRRADAEVVGRREVAAGVLPGDDPHRLTGREGGGMPEVPYKMLVHIGTSGWSYAHWTGVLYPNGLLPRERLAHYVPHFATAELNSSYYRWPRDAAFARWGKRLPPGFLLSVKAPGLLTHVQRLYGPERWIARIVRGLERLGERRGVLLVQLSPEFPVDEARLAYFLGQLPAGLPVAVEMRHPSWHCESVFALLGEHGAAYCVMSGAGLPCVLRATARIVYVRMHGPSPDALYAGSYSDADLRWWAARVREWASAGHEVFVYFNNDGEGHAVRNAATLRRLLNA